MTTLPVRSHRPDQASIVGLTKRFMVLSVNHLAGVQPVQQTSRMSSAAKPLLPHLKAKRGKREPMQDFQARQEKRSPELQCKSPSKHRLTRNMIGTAKLPSTHHQTTDQADTTGTVRPLSTHDQSTDQVGTNQAIAHRYL